MKFVDEAQIRVASGAGGEGARSFRREKFVPRGGPDGGDGGQGGDVVFIASSKLQTLMDLRIKRQYKAKNGSRGGKRNRSGAKGANCTIQVPCGTLIYDEAHQLLADLTQNGQSFIGAAGGRGGLGNSHFATSRNQTPTYAQPGEPGEEKTLTLELRLIAEIGLIGLPNAGKSTLLSVLTRSNPKTGAYPFTTLHPNLGVMKTTDQEKVVADLPGLIEGASEGVGLGNAFLRHVARTVVLVHIVSTESGDPETVWNNYQMIDQELKKGNIDLSEKKSVLVLSKLDTIDTKTHQKIKRLFTKKGLHPLSISSATHEGIQELKYHLLKDTP